MCLKKRKSEEALPEFIEQRKFLEGLLGRPLDLKGKEDYQDIIDTLVKHEAKQIVKRLQTIRMRAGEAQSKKRK
jgi:hypothetical protein